MENKPMPAIPFHVQVLAKFISVTKSKENLADGEVKKFNYSEGYRNKHKFNHQVVEFEDGFSLIWRHVSNDYYKCVGKFVERTC